MWLAGDAEHEAIRWFDAPADYDRRPGMRVNVLKADHHGSCNGVTSRYLRLTNPDWVVASLAEANEYGHMHEQAKAAYARAGKPWYRTDQNGTITIRSPGTRGGGYSIRPSRGRASAGGPSDRRSTQEGCNPVP
jgi:beta-lactamase superfamily II metal-dependent hydrolase